MCGICGIVCADSSGYDVRAIVHCMASTMVHRGPDDEGYYVHPGVGLGMRRLSIIDLSTGRQPISNEDQTAWVVFNGEIYNFRELRDDLEARGHRCKTQSDTETIIHAYEEYGEACLDHLRGMFAFAIWDERRRVLFLARDRLGIKPLYYTQLPNGFMFASEIKAILASGLVRPEVDLAAVSHYLSYGAVPSPLTIFQGIVALPPGHALRVERGQMTQWQYWWLPTELQDPRPAQDYLRQLHELLDEVVRLHQISDVPLGAFLSGGIDSSTLVALMGRTTDRPIRTFTLGFEEGPGELSEIEPARVVSETLKTDHREVIIRGEDLLAELPRIIWSLDQPSTDGVNSYFVSKIARQEVTVALSGLGGDEVFGGYPKFTLIPRFAPYLPVWRKVPALVRQTVVALGDRLISSKARSGWTTKLAGLGYVDSVETLYALSRIVFWPAQKAWLFTPQVWDLGPSVQDSVALLREYVSGRERDLVQQITSMEMRNYMAHVLLRDTDAMSMAHSLEVRVPWLDHKLVEFIYTIPPKVKLRGGQTKYLLQEVARDLLPPGTIQRPKAGFEFPIGHWLRHQLRHIVEAVLSPESVRARGLFRAEAVQEIYLDFVIGRQASWVPVWMFFVLELWMRRYVDGRDRLV